MYLFIFKTIFSIIFLCFFPLTTQAIGVSPTLLTLSPTDSVANLTLSNEHDVPVTMQLDLVKWTQNKDKDIYIASDELIVTPQIFTIAPHSSQLVRLGLESPLFKSKETAYRLFAQEVIPKLAVKNNGLKMALRLSLPVIIKPNGPIRQKAVWHSEQLLNKDVKIFVHNRGNNVLFINLLQVLSADQHPITKNTQTFAYLLPGSKKIWVIKALTNKKPALIKASINDHVVLENVV